MKEENLIYAIGALIIVGASIMKLNHSPGAEVAWTIAMFTVPGVIVYLALENMKMKKRLKETEK